MDLDYTTIASMNARVAQRHISCGTFCQAASCWRVQGGVSFPFYFDNPLLVLILGSNGAELASLFPLSLIFKMQLKVRLSLNMLIG